MSYLNIKFFSECLCRNISFEMTIPDGADEKPSVLFLLHGYRSSASKWLSDELTDKYNIAAVMPEGENGFWLDGLSTGHKYGTFIGCELVGYIRRTFGLADTPAKTALMGFSMGGFGALRTALAFPDTFGKAAGISPAMIIHDIAGTSHNVDISRAANPEYYRECFGDPSALEESGNNPEVLVRRIRESGGRMPDIYMACGTEDFLLENCRSFHRFLDGAEIRHTYIESKGSHSNEFRDEYAEKFCKMMFTAKER